MILNTGAPRSIVGHFASGAAAGLIASGLHNYSEFKQGAICKDNAMKKTLKAVAQSGLTTMCAIGVANALGKPKGAFSNLAEASAYIALGIAGNYAIDSILGVEKN